MGAEEWTTFHEVESDRPRSREESRRVKFLDSIAQPIACAVYFGSLIACAIGAGSDGDSTSAIGSTPQVDLLFWSLLAAGLLVGCFWFASLVRAVFK